MFSRNLSAGLHKYPLIVPLTSKWKNVCNVRSSAVSTRGRGKREGERKIERERERGGGGDKERTSRHVIVLFGEWKLFARANYLSLSLYRCGERASFSIMPIETNEIASLFKTPALHFRVRLWWTNFVSFFRSASPIVLPFLRFR